MARFTDVFRSRILPALVAALGVSFIAAGLLTYTAGTDAGTANESPIVISTAAPTLGADLSPAPTEIAIPSGAPQPTSILPSFGATPSDSAAPSGSPDGSPGASANPSGNPSPTPAPSFATGGNRVATRIVIPSLDIDLPIVKQPGSSTYPLCNVAMYISSLSQPGQPGSTYLYAHARVGMFLPLLDASKINNGKKMLGMLVQVYTSDNQFFLYEVTEVRRHQLTLADAITAKDSELWLQTSEGPRGTPGKLQLVATQLSNGPADPSEAHPTAKPVVCG